MAEHDGCKGCAYVSHGEHEAPCIKCAQNASDNYRRMTNADRIRSMSDEELAEIIMCPYDTYGKSVEIMPRVREGSIQELVPPEDCKKCIMEWLQSGVEVRA